MIHHNSTFIRKKSQKSFNFWENRSKNWKTTKHWIWVPTPGKFSTILRIISNLKIYQKYLISTTLSKWSKIFYSFKLLLIPKKTLECERIKEIWVMTRNVQKNINNCISCQCVYTMKGHLFQVIWIILIIDTTSKYLLKKWSRNIF